jgi:tRNA threonylcarbamoyl adenosine modification protein YjeE
MYFFVQFASLNLAEFEKIATTMALKLENPTTILLYGDLGAGKTTFVRAFINALCGEGFGEIVSPTFTLVQTYESPKGPLWHADLYRLKKPEEVLELGLLEAFTNAYCLIEWPQQLGEYTPSQYMSVSIAINVDGTRALDIQF